VNSLGLLGGARTPWVARLGAFAEVHPEVLLGHAVRAALARAGCNATDCVLLLVACDTPVGAQATNLARRVARSLDAEELPAFTIDGQGVAGLAGLAFASGLDGPVIIAGVDSTSVVAPGAGLVRDYGRPTPDEATDLRFLDAVVSAEGLTRTALDGQLDALRRRADRLTVGKAIAAVPIAGRAVAHDEPAPSVSPLDLLPLTDGGVVTAAHQAGLCDGAAAIVVAPRRGRAISEVQLTAVAPDRLAEALVDACREAPSPVALADTSVVLHEFLARRGVPAAKGAASVPVVGSVPSADGLRILVDMAERTAAAFTIVQRGRGGQLVRVSLDGS
jgi:hypothetical protein